MKTGFASASSINDAWTGRLPKSMCRWQRNGKRAAMAVYRRERIWWIAYHDQNRRRVQESSHSTIRRDAEHLYALRTPEALRGVYRQPVRITLDEFADRYIEHAKANKRSWLRDEQMLKPLKEFLGADRQLADIARSRHRRVQTPPAEAGVRVDGQPRTRSA